ncbi:MAG: helix-turn-helix domain-containing protein [Nitrospirae bacterium]|nr:helix-turn-helix domain-containing protein [Nitrospirota bacterium]
MSLETAATWCDVSPKTVQRWIGKGLPCYQEGPRTKVLIRPSDIETFLTKRQVKKLDLDAMVEAVFDELHP